MEGARILKERLISSLNAHIAALQINPAGCVFTGAKDRGKGYHAKVYFDARDDIFVGEVFGLNDSLNFHGSTVQELKEMFHQSIDNYLELCKELGEEPEREFKGSFNIRVQPELHRQLAYNALKEGKSLNQYINESLTQFVVNGTTDLRP